MPLVVVGNTASNLNNAHTNKKMSAGIKGEQTLYKHLEKWARNIDAPLLLAQSFTTDGKGDIDFLLATGLTLVAIDAKNWGTGTFSVTKDGAVRRSKTSKQPKGRKHADIHAGNQMTRLKKLLHDNNLDCFTIARPIVCMTSTLSNGTRIFYDDNWTHADYSLTCINDLPRVLDYTFPPDTRYPHPALEKLAHVLNNRKV